MMFSCSCWAHALARWTAPESVGSRRSRPTHRLAVEALEARELLAFDLGFAFGVGGPGMDLVSDVVADVGGGLTVSGHFDSGSIDLDPSGGAYALTNAGGVDGFVARHDAAGNLVWGVHLASTVRAYVWSLATDHAGNTFMAGTFESALSIGRPDAMPVSLSATEGLVLFLAKLDPAGNVLWARSLGEDGVTRQPRGITTDDTGNVYVTGSIFGAYQMFVTKYDAAGTSAWSSVTREGSNVLWGDGTHSSAGGNDVAVDADGNVYVTGVYRGKVDFNPDPKKTNTLTSKAGNKSFPSSDAFVLKLSPTGKYVWAGSMGGWFSDGGKGIVLDDLGNVYVSGYGWGPESDFDPGRGTLTLDGEGFLLKFDANRNLLWGVGGVGRSGLQSGGVALDTDGNPFIVGTFTGTFDADPGPGTFPLTATGNYNVLVQQLNSSGAFVWGGSMAGSGYDQGNAIALDGSGNVIVGGMFQGTTDFDPTASTSSLTSTPDASGVPSRDGFVAKLVPLDALQAGSVAPWTSSRTATLSSDQAAPLVTEAIRRWQAAGADTSSLYGVDVRIADLVGPTLGLASGRTIWLDDNAAGWGWFVDPTPHDDRGFVLAGTQGEQNRMDLLSVVMHELGHLLGHDHDEGGLMAATLAAGKRWTDSPRDDATLVDRVFGQAAEHRADGWLDVGMADQLESKRPWKRSR